MAKRLKIEGVKMHRSANNIYLGARDFPLENLNLVGITENFVCHGWPWWDPLPSTGYKMTTLICKFNAIFLMI